MLSHAISSVSAAEAGTGSRGERDHVRDEKFSTHTWDLTDLARSDTHTNPYGLAVFVTEGDLLVYDADDAVRTIEAGDSVYIPANTAYSMETKRGKLVEVRVF